ncbi:MAG: ferredoxin [bacterium]
MKLSVDKELCSGCELCVNSFPDLFEMVADTAKPRVDVVPEAAEDDARQAVEDCPAEAIKLEE